MKEFDTAHLFIGHPRRRSVARWVLVALLVTSAPAFGQTTTWIDGTGDWFSPANWSAGVPDSSTIADINNGGTAQIMSSGAAASLVEVGVGAKDTGTLSVSGSGNLDGGPLYVGRSGTGTVSITGGGVVSSGNFIIGENAGSDGTATVFGSGSMWTNIAVCFVGFNGNATLNITSGGQVFNSNATSIGENGTGTVIVDGVGSTWTDDAGIDIGGVGAGTLTISNGGHVSNFNSTVGRNPGSTGLVNVSGAGSSWTNNGFLELSGDGGDGTLHISSGAAVSNSSCSMGTFGGSGTSTVDGVDSAWTMSGDLSVGDVFGGVGTVTISQGGLVASAHGLIADGSSSTGSVQIDGADSTWINSGNVYVGGDASGEVGVGELNLTDGGTATAASVIVWGSGTVTGNGFIEATEVTNHGTLAPDQTISISGNLTFESTAIMSSTITPDSADSVMIEGTAGLNGQLDITLTGGPFIVGTQYTLLLANGGLNDTTFFNVSISAPPGVTALVTYDTNHVYLVIESAPTPTPTPTLTPTPTPTATPRPTPTPRARPTPAPRP
jgi:T5SS/PEP-CTERM-associated repeat protein